MRFNRTQCGVMIVMVVSLFFIALPVLCQTTPHEVLRYAQLANGQSGAGYWLSSILVSNANNFAITVELVDHDHYNPNNYLRTTYYTNCSVSGMTFTIPANSACRLNTDGVGTLESGWIRFSTRNYGYYHLGGYVTYTYFSLPGNTAITTIGISATPIMQQFSFPVVRDAASGLDTAWALVNPWSDYVTTMVADLYQNGTKIATATITQQIYAHISEFLSTSQFNAFRNILQNANNFVGNMVVHGYTSNDDIIAAVLINRDLVYGGATVTVLQTNPLSQKADRRQEAETMTPAPQGKLVHVPWLPIL